MSKWAAFRSWLLAPAHLGWRGRTFFTLACLTAAAAVTLTVPWYVDHNGSRFGPIDQYVWEGPPGDLLAGRYGLSPGAVLMSSAGQVSKPRIAWWHWVGEAVWSSVLLVGLWCFIRHEARMIRYNRGHCWKCADHRKSLPRDKPCVECGAPFDPAYKPKPDLCPNCKYDLQGTPPALIRRCPECGTRVHT